MKDMGSVQKMWVHTLFNFEVFYFLICFSKWEFLTSLLFEMEKKFLDFKRMQNLDFMEIDGLWKFMTSEKGG